MNMGSKNISSHIYKEMSACNKMDFESNTVKQLRIIAKERGVKGYSRLQYSSPLLKLSAILKTARTDSSTTHTHVLLSKPYGKIDVSDNMPEFLTTYLECV